MNVIKQYASLEEFIADITDYSTYKNPRISSLKDGSEWSGAASVEEAIANARGGVNLEHVAVKINETERLNPRKMDVTYDVSGAQVDVASFLAGTPECMVTFEEQEAPKFAVLNVNIVESDGTSNIVFNNKAIATACLVDELESQGYRVKLNVVGGVQWRKYGVGELTITVKEFEQKMSIAQLTGCIHKGFFRRLFLAWAEKYCPMNPKLINHGSPRNFPPQEGILLPADHLTNDTAIQNFIDNAVKGILAEPK